jgi:hypothetical protein
MGRGIGKNFKLADAAAAEDALKALMAQNEQNMQTNIVKKQQNVNKSSETQTKLSATKSNTNTPSAPAEVTVPAPHVSEKKNITAATFLKNYALSNKKPSPIFKDLGERKNGPKIECTIECCFMEVSAIGTGATRLDAREDASRLVAEKLGIGKKKTQKKAQPQKVNAPKKEVLTDTCSQKENAQQPVTQKQHKRPGQRKAKKPPQKRARKPIQREKKI